MQSREPLISKEQTGRKMRALVGRFARDLDSVYVRVGRRRCPFSALTAAQVHKVVREIPYRRDTAPVEVVARPARLLNGEFYSGLDCKKKAQLLAAWAIRNHLPYRFVASSRRPDRRFHHVFPQIRFGREWVNMDATYRYMRPGSRKVGTAFEVLP